MVNFRYNEYGNSLPGIVASEKKAAAISGGRKENNARQ